MLPGLDNCKSLRKIFKKKIYSQIERLEHHSTAAPDDKNAVQEYQNSNCSAGKDTEAELTATWDQ